MASGSIKRREDTGRWRARIRDQHGRMVSRDFDAKRAAEAWLRETARAVELGTYVRPAEAKARADAERRAAERSTVGAVHTLWRDGLTLKPSTLTAYDSLWRTVVAPRWAAVPVAEVRFPVVKAWLASLDLSASRRRQAWHVLSSVLATAVADGCLEANPLAGASKGALPGLPAPKAADHPLTPEEVAAVAEAARASHGDRAAVLVLVLGTLGLRWGEAVALRRSDVTLRGDLRVRRTVQALSSNGRRELVWGEPKTERGRRQVPMPDDLRDHLAPLLADLGPDDVIFSSPRSPRVPWDASNFRRRVFDPAVRASGLDPVRIHDLRHAAITAWIERDRLSLQTVSALAGHASVAFTLQRYGHLLRDWQEDARAAMNARERAVPAVCPEPVRPIRAAT